VATVGGAASRTLRAMCSASLNAAKVRIWLIAHAPSCRSSAARIPRRI
jgi:hypothetical protein